MATGVVVLVVEAKFLVHAVKLCVPCPRYLVHGIECLAQLQDLFFLFSNDGRGSCFMYTFAKSPF